MANLGVEDRLCVNAVLLNPSDSLTAVLRYFFDSSSSSRSKIIIITIIIMITITIKRGIFQGDSLPLLLFCIALIPLTHELNRSKCGTKYMGLKGR
jgi:hypothetical protein